MSAVKGEKKIKQNLAKAVVSYQDALAAATYVEALNILKESRKRVPVETGRLRNTGYAAPPGKISNPVAQVGYDTEYAVPVHERVEVFHEVGGPLYLKSVVDKHTAGYSTRISRRAKALQRMGVGAANVPSTEPKQPGG